MRSNPGITLREPHDAPHLSQHGAYNDQNNVAFRVDSLSEAVRFFDTAPKDVGDSGYGRRGDDKRSSHKDSEDEWSGGAWEVVREQALRGWPEGVDKVGQLVADIAHLTNFADKPGLVLGEDGAEIDIDRYLQGEPDCWNAWDAKPNAPVQRITCVISYHAGINTEVMRMTGATAAAVADSMEQAGIRTELWAMAAIATQKNYALLVPLKRTQDPLIMDNVAFGMAHPGMFRRITFGMMEHVWRRHGSKGMPGYGRPLEISEIEERMNLDLGLVLGGRSGTVKNLDDAVRLVETQLDEAGVDLDY